MGDAKNNVMANILKAAPSAGNGIIITSKLDWGPALKSNVSVCPPSALRETDGKLEMLVGPDTWKPAPEGVRFVAPDEVDESCLDYLIRVDIFAINTNGIRDAKGNPPASKIGQVEISRLDLAKLAERAKTAFEPAAAPSIIVD